MGGTYDVGDKVRYWSNSHQKWVEAHVQKVHRAPDGSILSYDLSKKPQVDASQAQGNSAPSQPKRRELPKPLKRKASNGEFEVGTEVQYFSEVAQRYIEATVEAVMKEADGSLIYDLNVKKGVQPDHLRAGNEVYKEGDDVEYWSVSVKTWVPAKVTKFDAAAQLCDLDVKPLAPAYRVRKAKGVPPPPPPPDPVLLDKAELKQKRREAKEGKLAIIQASPYKVGEQVQYKSETKETWVKTTVQDIRVKGGERLYDLDCKKGATEARLRHLPRVPEGIEVGAEIEYWSETTKKWLPGKVVKIHLDQGTADLDIKPWAPFARIRPPTAETEELRRLAAEASAAAAAASGKRKPPPSSEPSNEEPKRPRADSNGGPKEGPAGSFANLLSQAARSKGNQKSAPQGEEEVIDDSEDDAHVQSVLDESRRRRAELQARKAQ